ncbi:conjugal transfer protein [Enterococcus faecalis]|nr:conjugal transfer protein [Enterococcus faecalis]EGO9344433.1 conjugal transfer protein [Enterococcus faecalis]
MRYWLKCPVCGSRTRVKLCKETVLINFPLFCPKCKNETFVHVKLLKTTIIKEPDAKTQRRRADNLRN